jgi:hypothetical protein
MAIRSAHTSGRRGRLRATESVAGWIFADLLLVLFIVGLGTAIPHEVEADPPKPPPKPKAEPKPQIIGMKTSSTKVTVGVDADALLGSGVAAAKARRAACLEVRDATADLTTKKAEAALVMIFGGHPDEASRAQGVAAAVGQQLNCASPTLFPKASFGPGKTASRADVASGREITGVVRPFWNGRLPYGEAQLEIYVFTTQKQGNKK